MKYYFYSLLGLIVIVIAIFGFRDRRFTQPPIEIFNDMDHQLKYKAQKNSEFFSDDRIAREPIPGTVAYGLPVDNPYKMTGMDGNHWGDGIPMNVDAAFMERGRERYDINCAICHGKTGLGNGVVGNYGLIGIANLHQEQFRTMADGRIFHTIGHGKGLMGAYPHISIEDRWAIIAYLRALQRSQNSSYQDVPRDILEELKKKQ